LVNCVLAEMGWDAATSMKLEKLLSFLCPLPTRWKQGSVFIKPEI
jgi:hypothetical protein